jgi:hypothetical protein
MDRDIKVIVTDTIHKKQTGQQFAAKNDCNFNCKFIWRGDSLYSQ